MQMGHVSRAFHYTPHSSSTQSCANLRFAVLAAAFLAVLSVVLGMMMGMVMGMVMDIVLAYPNWAAAGKYTVSNGK